MEESSSNSSNQNPRWKHHVFLSFKGEDTRNGFTDHLYAALKRNGVQTFRDDEKLETGEVISQEHIKAIQESLFAIVVLSPNYPSSSRCLDELQEILESRRVFGRQVFPVFYGVDPSHLRHQKESFVEVFQKHEKGFCNDNIKVQKWREALREITNLSGWDSRNQQEAKLIEQIVQQICMELQPLLPSHHDELVGIDSKIKYIYSLLKVNEMNDVSFIGISGMGGVGKTTLARVVYERIKNLFDDSCFLQDVREVSEREGLLELQRKLLSDLKVKGMEIKDSFDGQKILRNLLYKRRILLVLDDVSTISQLENLAGNKKWFGQGSRVIVTTRDTQLMKTHGNGAFENYEVGLLNRSESFQLFFQKAFQGYHTTEGYLELSERVVQYAGGLPLALKVLGSFLYGRSIPKWKDALDMLRQHSQDDILKVLRLSFDGLEYPYKIIFLDIACFFRGWDRNHVTHILQICGRNPTIGIDTLIEKSLVTCENEILGMHNLLQNMGKHIVFHESPNDACGRSRLWCMEDIHHVLAKNKENKAIEGIILNLHEPYERLWNLEAFSKICNLKLLILRTSLHLSNGLNCLSNALRVLEWEGYPSEYFPSGIQLHDLVDLKLHHSKIKQLWNGIKFFQKLKFIDLSYSEYLIQMPNVSEVPHLETLIFKGCINLVEVHQTVSQHKKLVILNLKDCLNLKILPNKLEMNSLEKLILSGCSKVKKLPEFGENMKCLSMLDLKDCKRLLCLPNTIRNLKSLKILNISGCTKFSRLPDSLNENEALEELNASGTAIRDIPSSIFHLENLQKLSFQGCKGSPSNSWGLSLPFRWFQKLQRHLNPMGLILPSISQMSMLIELDLSYCNLGDESLLDNLGCLPLLRKLDLSGNNFVNFPTNSIAGLSKLLYLGLNYCARLQTLPATFPPSLEDLHAQDCASMEFVPYTQQLCDFFASYAPELHNSSCGLILPGSEIPAGYDNQNYCSKECILSLSDSKSYSMDSVSIIVDIPVHCRSSKPWGIAVCLVLEYTSSPNLKTFHIMWTCGDSKDICNLKRREIGVFNSPHLYIDFFWSEHWLIEKNLIGDKNQLEFVFYCGSVIDTSNCEEEAKLKIRKCGWRLYWKDNAGMWSHALTEPKCSIGNVQCQQDVFQENDATLSKRRKLH